MTLTRTRSSSFLHDLVAELRRRPAVAAVAGGAVLVAAAALVNRQLARKAERENPPAGKFIDVDGVRLHYVERGSGRPLLLLHGNGTMIQDLQSSGLFDLAAEKYRVVAFDRPGFGHSSRPVAFGGRTNRRTFSVRLSTRWASRGRSCSGIRGRPRSPLRLP